MSYLNTRPLIYGLKRPPVSDLISLYEDNPARLASLLQQGEIDLGLIPVSAIQGLSEYHIAGDYCISTDGEAGTVCLFSEVPIHDIRKIYLDYQSMTSVALLKWLARNAWKIDPEFIPAENDAYLEKINGETAGLVIGDRAFEQRTKSRYAFDLGTEWKNATGLPFVFAAWVSRTELKKTFISRFNEANALGLDHLDEIVAAQSFPLYDLKKYYTLHLNYRLDEEKRKALAFFLNETRNEETVHIRSQS